MVPQNICYYRGTLGPIRLRTTRVKERTWALESDKPKIEDISLDCMICVVYFFF